MMLRKTARATLAAALALGLATPSLAQNAPGPTPSPVPPPTPGAPPPERVAPKMNSNADRVERHIAELRRRLKITPAEKTQWDAFAQVMRDNAARMDEAFEARAANPNMSALDDLKAYAAIAQTHAEDMQRLLPAFEALYAAMTPDQQKVADTVFRDFENRRGGRHGMP
jgi:protein CpxP